MLMEIDLPVNHPDNKTYTTVTTTKLFDANVVGSNPGCGPMDFSLRQNYVRIKTLNENIVRKPVA